MSGKGILRYFQPLTPSSGSASTPSPKRSRVQDDNEGGEEEEEGTPSKSGKRLKRDPLYKIDSVNTPSKKSTPSKPYKRIRVLQQEEEEEEGGGGGEENDKSSTFNLDRFKSPSSKTPSKKLSPPNKSDDFLHLSLPFLQPETRRDASGHPPSHPQFNPSTLFVPESFLSSQTPAQHQWWTLKSKHFDKLLFFKMGKFYEIFHMDALEVVRHIDMQLMKKESAHCGFPEASFDRYADILVSKNLQVLRIEQTETPEGLELRTKGKKGLNKWDKVIRREVCQMISNGTKITTYSASSHKDLEYLVSITADKSRRIGIACVESTVGQILIGELDGEEGLSRLQLHLCHLNPVEFLLNENTDKSLRNFLESRYPQVPLRVLKPGSQFLTPEATLERIKKNSYYSSWPYALESRLEHNGQRVKEEYAQSFSAFGALIWYLSESLIDYGILSQGKVEELSLLCGSTQGQGLKHMILDDASLYNLDVLPKNRKDKSLFGILDSTVTPSGRRLLKKWVIRPLFDPSDIRDRQEAISELSGYENLSKDDLKDLKTFLKRLPDFERLTGLIASSGHGYPPGHPETRAVYVDGSLLSKRKLEKFISCLEGLTDAHGEIKSLMKVHDFKSKILHRLLHQDYPKEELDTVIKYFQTSLDTKSALKSGKIIPSKGLDPEYDTILEEKKAIEAESKGYIDELKAQLRTDQIKFFGSGKNAFQIELPMFVVSKIDSDFEFTSRRKGFNRYATKESKGFLERMSRVLEKEASILNSASTRVYKKFSSHSDVWQKLIYTISTLDALLSLAKYSYSSIDGVFPTFTQDPAVLEYKEGFHPILHQIGTGDFIPNDLNMGHDTPPLMILTGANMGGKSTLMRQTALLSILGQIGCKVPASLMTLSPIDRIFTRIGASDNIFGGESTFMVELSETSRILSSLSPASFIIIDELGRGTTTYDGMSLAFSTVNHLARSKARVMFSTHFHRIMSNFASDPRISIRHMAFIEEGENVITFLYKLSFGACPKSHGFNTARLAGLPEDVVNLGSKASMEYEKKETLMENLMVALKALCGPSSSSSST